MKSVLNRTLPIALAWLFSWAGSAAFAADQAENKPAEPPLVEPAEPAVPERVRALLAAGKYAEAAQAVDQAADEKDANHQWLAYLKGRALYLAAKYDDAVAAYQQAEEKFPESRWRRRYRFGRALALARKGDFQAAEQIYRAEAEYLLSADRKREIAEVYLEFAERYFKPADERESPDYQKALEFYGKALESLGAEAPGQVGAKRGKEGRFAIKEEGRSATGESGDESPHSKEEIELRVARCFQELGNLQEAANRYAQFTKDHPASKLDLEARYRWGGVQLALDQKEPARRTWQDLLAAYGDNKNRRVAEAAFKLSETYSLPQPSSD
ncbi:MAG TPA: tetratricopeptide repeat protein, partial [Pirellulales bacterium]